MEQQKLKEKRKEKLTPRRRKKKIRDLQELMEQKRFVINYKDDPQGHERAVKFIVESNKKSHGRAIDIKDLVDYALSKISKKDIEKIKNRGLEEMDKVKIMFKNYNKKHGTDLTFGEFLVKVLKIEGVGSYDI